VTQADASDALPLPAGPNDEPIVVWSEGIRAYDFGPSHPLTPRRFGPGIGLVRAVGAERFLEPPEASDEALGRLHDARYIRQVRSFSDDPWQPPAMGIGPGDCPPFHGMHEASALVAGGSLAVVAAVLDGDAMHAFNPGGGLHHAMAARASGFCIYNDVALAVAAARDAGHRVLYVDLDVHHGDGTQELFWDDPSVLTVSIHESGRTLFPGTGEIGETGGPGAEGTALNVPLELMTGDASWWSAVGSVLPALAAVFRPTFLVTQHGCDSHVLDPLAHLRLTTEAYMRATALLDELAHRWCEGRWVATGGGGYDAYRVVPRSWALVWLAQAHRTVPDALPEAWREAWAEEAARHGQAPLPHAFRDEARLSTPEPHGVAERNARTTAAALARCLELLGRH
jgi:acetoin utilization protein AcuC